MPPVSHAEPTPGKARPSRWNRLGLEVPWRAEQTAVAPLSQNERPTAPTYDGRVSPHCGSLIGSRALAAYGDVDGPSAANNRPWSRKCTARLLRRSDASASVHGCAGTHSVRLAGAGSVG